MRTSLIVLRFLLTLSLLPLPCASGLHAQEPRPVVALMTELSGPFAANGADCRQGYETAVALYNNSQKKSEVLYGDTQGDAKSALNEFKKLIDTNKVSLIVTNRSQVAAALNPVSASAHIPYFAIAAHPDVRKDNPYAFRIWPSAAQEGEALAKDVFARGHARVAMVALEDEYTSSSAEEFKKSFEANGGVVVLRDTVLGSTLEFASLISKIKRTDPNALYVNLGIHQLGHFLRKLKEQGVTQQIYTNFWVQNREVLEAAGSTAEGVLFEDMILNAPKLSSLIEQKYGKTLAPLHLVCFLASSAALQAASQAQSPAPQDVFKSLQRLTAVQIPDGEIAINDREITIPVGLKRLEAGRVVKVGHND